LSLLLRRPPGREAYPGDIFSLHARLLERATCLNAAQGGGSMTALPIVETQLGEIAAYIPTNLISITDGQIYLDRDLFTAGFRPAIDIARSVSRIGGQAQHPRIKEEARRMKLDYLQFLELEVFTRFGARLEASMETAIRRGHRLRELLKQERLATLTASLQLAWMIAFNEGMLDDMEASAMATFMQPARGLAGAVAGQSAVYRGDTDMTRRFDLERHRRSLGEIREIMNSMKTLAYMETRKLNRFLSAQQAVVHSIEAVADDLLSFYPQLLPEFRAGRHAYLLIGTERGFCGDLNHALLEALAASEHEGGSGAMLIAVGRRLAQLVEDDERLVAMLPGASVAEEVTGQLGQLVSELTALQAMHPELNLYCLYHGGDAGVVVKRLLPPFQQTSRRERTFAYPPLLQLTPATFVEGLIEQYLFAVLHEILYTALMTENYTRLSHLEGAVSHLDEETEHLGRECNALRQEEIIEEIEVILLSSGGLGDGGASEFGA
jgi:F0F1-type ATP synthase gamma subunit